MISKRSFIDGPKSRYQFTDETDLMKRWPEIVKRHLENGTYVGYDLRDIKSDWPKSYQNVLDIYEHMLAEDKIKGLAGKEQHHENLSRHYDKLRAKNRSEKENLAMDQPVIGLGARKEIYRRLIKGQITKPDATDVFKLMALYIPEVKQHREQVLPLAQQISQSITTGLSSILEGPVTASVKRAFNEDKELMSFEKKKEIEKKKLRDSRKEFGEPVIPMRDPSRQPLDDDGYLPGDNPKDRKGVTMNRKTAQRTVEFDGKTEWSRLPDEFKIWLKNDRRYASVSDEHSWFSGCNYFDRNNIINDYVNSSYYESIYGAINYRSLIIKRAQLTEVTINGKLVNPATIRVEGVDYTDSPRFSDSYVESASFFDGTPLNEQELIDLKDNYAEIINKLAHESLRAHSD